MTNEEALTYLKNKSCVLCAISDDFDYASAFKCQHSDCLIHKASVVAVEALSKQIAKKPLPEERYYGIGKCPTCNAVFLDKSTKFCGNCGQALDFSD